MVTLLLLHACTGTEAPPTEAVVTPPPMPIARLASRVALDTVGRRPTEAELDAVEADPAQLDVLLETWMADPAFEERVVSLYADIYRTRTDHYVVGVDGDAEFYSDAADAEDLIAKERIFFQRAVGEEPVRLLAHVAATDLPWTDIVTADWSMGDDHLLAHFPMAEIDAGGSGWRPVRYDDGRPASGVLATNGMWWRYTSTVDNLNRGRAAALSRVLLCDTRYDQIVEFTPTSDLDPADRIVTDPACIACHVTLDPLGSTLWGFWRHHPESYTEALRYYPSREEDWRERGMPEPSYYGSEVDSLYGLGRAIANDPRFATCAVEQVWGFLLDRTPNTDEIDRFNEDREAFIAGGITFRSLFRAVADDPWYRSDSADYVGTTGPRRLTPDQLGTAVAALTGYLWSIEGGIDPMVNDDYGYRILTGGVDGLLVTDAPTSESTPTLLVQERLAELAGPYAASREAEQDPAARTLFREVASLDAEPTDAELRAQLVGLYRRVHGTTVATDSTDVDGLVALWSDVRAASATPREAWGLMLSAYLRHPDFVMY